MLLPRHRFRLLALLSVVTVTAGVPSNAAPPQDGVFDQRRRQGAYLKLQLELQQCLRKKDPAGAEQRLLAMMKLAPLDSSSHYNMACVKALQGSPQKALEHLARAVELGFLDVRHITSDPDLLGLHQREAFKKIVARAGELARKPPDPWEGEVNAAPVSKGVAMVAEENTVWDFRNGIFRCFFKLGKKPARGKVVEGHGKAGIRLRRWYWRGTAAGNHGDFYDNHDNDHSNMAYEQFPQLSRIEFCEEARKRHLSTGLQLQFLYNGVVLGNSSTAITQGPFWRSTPRVAYVNPRNAALLHAQYLRNHLYFYPEHRDHDPREGQGGKGDLYPANTPYVIISQGSSGPDRPFMDAVAFTLASFRPEVKRLLVEKSALMPTVQMIFRSSSKALEKPEDYLTGKAHPTVFPASSLDLETMATMAHDMPKDAVPPLIRLRVVEEDRPVVGRDYFDVGERERLFDTPSAIARVFRTTRYHRRMVVSAQASTDLNGRPLTWHWAVLRGDAEAIKITPRNASGSVVELQIPYHRRRPVLPGSPMDSCRVDIGAFAHNGKYYSAPAFVTFCFLDNETRVYDETKRIRILDYTDPETRSNYVDPQLDYGKSWRDEYHYDAQGALTGWTRTAGQETQEFTSDGKLVVKKDGQGRPVEVKDVRYVARQGGKGPLVLTMEVVE